MKNFTILYKQICVKDFISLSHLHHLLCDRVLFPCSDVELTYLSIAVNIWIGSPVILLSLSETYWKAA